VVIKLLLTILLPRLEAADTPWLLAPNVAKSANEATPANKLDFNFYSYSKPSLFKI